MIILFISSSIDKVRAGERTKQKKAAGRQLCEPSCVPGLRTDTSEEAGICHVNLVELLTNGWPQPTFLL